MGVQTCGQLAAIDSDLLEAELGRQAEALIHRAQGIDKRQVQVVRGPAKSISQEWTFSKDVSDPAILREQLQKMCSSVARSL
jgi:DNA polymerase-4